MAPPRQKACRACIKAKRRCDLGTPACGRCCLKSLQCTYGSFNPQASNWTVPAESVSSNSGNTESDNWKNNQAAQMVTQISAGHEATAASAMNSPHLSSPNESIDWSVLMTDIDDFIIPDLLHLVEDDEPEVTAGQIYQARVVYGMKQLKSWPSMFGKRCYNCFINHNLWSDGQIPTILLDALSACNLYENKTIHNEAWVFLHIGSKAQTLVSDAGYGGNWTSPMDQLVAVQVLILYQIIRLFDGDIRQRAEAETVENILDLWTEQLKARITQISSKQAPTEALTTNPATPGDRDMTLGSHSSDWQSWIFNESVRRTVLVSYLLRGTYTFLKMGWDNMSRQVRSCTFIAQAGLWNATTEYQWQLARNELRPFEVTVRYWDTEMDSVRPEDLDELGVTLFAFIKGMESLREWLGRDGLEKFGLT